MKPEGRKLTVPIDDEKIVKLVREQYGKIAEQSGGGCCSVSIPCCGDSEKVATEIGYGKEDLDAVPENANLGLGCGAPISHLRLQPGETVLDLGAGAGFDAFLAAPKVGETGKVIGVDMTPEMIERARANAAKAGHAHVEFRQGRLEELPVEDASVDAVTSNCVINLVPDKGRVFSEVARVLRPGGRMVVSDIVLDGALPESVRQDLLAYVGCLAGAMQRDNYFAAIEAAGLTDIEVLKDVDYLGALDKAQPEEVAAFVERTGAKMEELRGKVHSLTLRAVKK
jgi:arsenite methyltransferase